jgi:hypothetical protein
MALVAAFNKRGLGKDPTVTDHVYVPLPPVAAKVCE